jgi:hypothetical protein
MLLSRESWSEQQYRLWQVIILGKVASERCSNGSHPEHSLTMCSTERWMVAG